jgi:lipopolysaccharide export system permease protein
VIKTLHLYLAYNILIAFLFSSLAVSFVVLFTQSFRLLSFVIDNSGTMVAFFQLMGLMIPTFLPLILPISFGVAVLFIYHKFAVDSELVVMRSAGFSPLRLAMPAIVLSLLLIIGGGLLTMWATPAANRALVSLQYKVRDSYSAVMLRPGTFNDLDEGLTIYTQKRGSGGHLENILVHDVRTPQKPVTIMAKTGQFSIEKGAPQIVVFNGRRQEVDVQSGRLQELEFGRYVLDLHLLKNEKVDRQPDPRELPMTSLWKDQGKASLTAARQGRMRAELHQRLAGPFLSLSFALIGATVILIGSFNRKGMTRRVLLAAVFIVVTQAAMIGLVTEINKSPLFIPILYTVALLPVPICLYLLSRPTLFMFRRMERT